MTARAVNCVRFDLNLDRSAAPPFDPVHRRVGQQHVGWQKLRQQRAESLPAERVVVAIDRAGEIDGRDFVQVLAAGERSQHEFDRLLPFAEVLGQRLVGWNVGLAARRGRDGVVGAHEAREEILEFALARIAPADAHALAGRRRIDVQPVGAPSLASGLMSAA